MQCGGRNFTRLGGASGLTMLGGIEQENAVLSLIRNGGLLGQHVQCHQFGIMTHFACSHLAHSARNAQFLDLGAWRIGSVGALVGSSISDHDDFFLSAPSPVPTNGVQGAGSSMPKLLQGADLQGAAAVPGDP